MVDQLDQKFKIEVLDIELSLNGKAEEEECLDTEGKCDNLEKCEMLIFVSFTIHSII